MGFVPIALLYRHGGTFVMKPLTQHSDAAKVPPSRFQKRKGSIYATPSSRDGHVDKNKVEKYFAKIAEMKGTK